MIPRVPHGTCFGTADGRLYEAFCPPWYRLDLWLGWWANKLPWAFLGRVRRAQGIVVLYDRDADEVRLRVVESRVRLPRVLCEDEARSPAEAVGPTTRRR